MTSSSDFDVQNPPSLEECIQQLREVASIDAEYLNAITRCLAIRGFLQAMNVVANIVPALDGVDHSSETSRHHLRVDMGAALALAEQLPDDLLDMIRPEVDELRQLAASHNLSLIRWKRSIHLLWNKLEHKFQKPHYQLAMRLVMQVMDSHDAVRSIARLQDPTGTEDFGTDVLQSLESRWYAHARASFALYATLDSLTDDSTDGQADEALPADLQSRPGDQPDEALADTDKLASPVAAVPEPVPLESTPWSSAPSPAQDLEPDVDTLPRVNTDELAFLDTNIATIPVRNEREQTTFVEPKIAQLGARIRRLHWTIGAVCVAAAVLLIAMGVAVNDAQDRARESSERANQPIQLQVIEAGIPKSWFEVKLPGTLQIGDRTITVRRTSR